MINIFVFTAGNKSAQEHLNKTFKNGINLKDILDFCKEDEKEEINSIAKGHGLYAWGAVPGISNERYWNLMKRGDYVLCVYNNTYHYVTKILAKFRNAECARKLWGDNDQGETWELIYFVEKPEEIDIPVKELSDYLNKAYMGFTKISDDKIKKIENDFGSVDNFIEKKIIKNNHPTSIGDPINSSVTSNSLQTTNSFNRSEILEKIIRYIGSRGYVYEPWQIAQYVTALRTKPFVILAGITGTGKSKLPALVAKATGNESRLIPVRPDWTDSSEILGYIDLQGKFRPGAILRIAKEAISNGNKFWTAIIDEMNLARVEYYFAEILSKIEEDIDLVNEEEYGRSKLIEVDLPEKDSADWGNIYLPSNLGIVGTVNMDESSHSFSKKVLDRAFTIEISNVDLDFDCERSKNLDNQLSVVECPLEFWKPRATRLPYLRNCSESEREKISKTIGALKDINNILSIAQLQIGYRTRDEIVLFVIHSHEVRNAFRDRKGNLVDPLDLAIQMKILPRIIGGSSAIHYVVSRLLVWSKYGKMTDYNEEKIEEEVSAIFKDWKNQNRTSMLGGAVYPKTAAKLSLMWERLQEEGYTSYWI